jgi:hypothetical protein
MRAHWELLVAASILLGVLLAIDAVFIGRPALALSLAPLLLLVVAALVRLTPRVLMVWIAAFVLLSVDVHDARLVGLVYPAVVLLVLSQASRWRQT